MNCPWIVITAILYTQVESCKLSHGPGNPFPWLIRIWYHGEHVVQSRAAIAQGALVSSNRVISPCSVLKKLKTRQLSLTGYHFKPDGSYDCHITQTVYSIEHHPRCEGGNPDGDFTLWHFSYPFAVEGQPYLFTSRPSNQKFLETASNAALNRTRCELPVFSGVELKSETKIQRTVNFLTFKEYTTICGKSNCPQLKADVQNVDVLYVTRNKNETVRGARYYHEDHQMGAVLVCDGFPLGLTGLAIPPLKLILNSSGASREYSFVSNFLNYIDIIFPPPKPVGRTIKQSSNHRFKPSTKHIQENVESLNQSTTVPLTKTANTTVSSLERKHHSRRKMMTNPEYIDDLERFLNRGNPSLHRVPSTVLIVIDLFANWIHSSCTHHRIRASNKMYFI